MHRLIAVVLLILLNPIASSGRPADPHRLVEYEQHELSRLKDIPLALNVKMQTPWAPTFAGWLVADGMNLAASVVYKSLLNEERLQPTELAQALQFFANTGDVETCDAIKVKYSLPLPAMHGTAAQCALAIRAMKAGNAKEAQSAEQAAFKDGVDPNDQNSISALGNLAKAYMAAKQPGSAARVLSRALANQSTSELNWSQVELLGEYYAALRAQGKEAAAKDVLGRLDATMANAEAFVSHAPGANRVPPHSVVMNNLALLFRENGQPQTSLAILEKTVPPRDQTVQVIETYIAGGKFEQARKLLDEQLSPASPNRQFLLKLPEIANQYDLVGHFDDAVALLVHALKRSGYVPNFAANPSASIALKLGELLEKHLNVADEKRLFRKQPTIFYPSASVMQETLFDLLLAAGKPEDAITIASLRAVGGSKLDDTERWMMVERALDAIDKNPQLDTKTSWEELASSVPGWGYANCDVQIRVCERMLRLGAKYQGDAEILRTLRLRLENAQNLLKSQLH